MSVTCQDNTERRVELVNSKDRINGIDFVTTRPVADDKKFIFEVTLFRPHDGLSEKNIRVFDSRKNTFIKAEPVPDEGTPAQQFLFQLQNAAIGRTYYLKLVELDVKPNDEPEAKPDADLDGTLQTDLPLSGFDPAFVESDFVFYEEDKQTTHVDPEHLPSKPFPQRPEPEVNYLAKDYQSFRQLILDRLAKVMPDWREHHAADVGTALVELLAYSGDQLSYAQDAVATEAYLETARKRISVRRHARLVDYQIHEGANSIGLVHLEVAANGSLDPNEVFFITRPPSQWEVGSPVFNSHELDDLDVNWPDQVEGFEPIVEWTTDWQLKPGDLIDTIGFLENLNELVEKFNDIPQPKEGRANVFESIAPLYKNPRHLSEKSQADLISKINQILEDADGAKIREFAGTDPKRESNCPGKKSLGLEALKREHPNATPAMVNRYWFDQVFSQFISPANFSKRFKFLKDHNQIYFYTWGETECWLPKGATSVTLGVVDSEHAPCSTNSDSKPQFKETSGLYNGQILIFEEIKGPKTDRREDANPHHRQAVRITKITKVVDKVPDRNQTVFEVEWAQEDALKFPLCISSTTSPSSTNSATGCQRIKDVSVARGNVVLVDHGRTISSEEIDGPTGYWEQVNCGSEWDEPYWIQKRDSYSPILREPNLTSVRSRTNFSPISRLLFDQPHKASPSIRLTGSPAVPGTGKNIPITKEMLADFDLLMKRLNHWEQHQADLAYATEDLLTPETMSLLACYRSQKKKDAKDKKCVLDKDDEAKLKRNLLDELGSYMQWTPEDDLIGSGPHDHHFVAEIDNQRRTHMRFGDGDSGRSPDAGMRFTATYRVGNGIAGNVGPDSITHMATRNGLGREITDVRNPLATSGGIAPETLKNVKVKAPNQYRSKQNRAILGFDYQQIVMRNFGDRLQAARAKIDSRGVYWDVTVVIDPLAHERNFEELRETVRKNLFRYKRIGHEVNVKRAEPVPLELVVHAQLHEGALRAEVFRDLSNVFSSRDLGYGKRGFFHPDNLTFGQSIHVSELISEARKIAGIKSVVIEKLARLDRNENVARGAPQRQTPEGALEPIDAGAGASTAPEPVGDDGPPNTLDIGPLEIARLDNLSGDGSQFGKLTIILGGDQ